MEQKLKSEITKRKILDSAESEFAEKGFSAARVDEIAEKAGVNKQLIYVHFKNKDLLYTAVLERVYSRLAICEKTISEKEFEGIETLRDIIIEYFDFLSQNTSFVRLVLWENLNYARNSKNINTTLFSGITRILKSGIEKGIIRKNLDVEQTVISMNMFCFSAFSNIYTVSNLIHKDLSEKDELKKRAEHIADILVQYVLGVGEESK